MNPLSKQEIDEMHMAATMIWGTNPMPAWDRLIYTAKIGAAFLLQTEMVKRTPPTGEKGQP
jgi:hypothetical protein